MRNLAFGQIHGLTGLGHPGLDQIRQRDGGQGVFLFAKAGILSQLSIKRWDRFRIIPNDVRQHDANRHAMRHFVMG